MPAPATATDFLSIVQKSGLVPPDRLEHFRTAFADQLDTASTEKFAEALIDHGMLTRFQVRQLKQGRYKRFTIAGKYRLLELLGVGGMGAVYLCEHIHMKRLVALKVLPESQLADPGNIERFYREARAIATLNDPNIVRAYDIDQSEGLHFLVMEYVDGTSLQEIVARFGPMDHMRAATYIAQAANGLQHACELSIVHRDIKPGNLLLDRTGVLKILDMGLARFFSDKQDNLTAKYDGKAVLGTADYLAPEQCLSTDVDSRADIYALGGTLFFLLSARSPVPEGPVAQKLIHHQSREPIALTHLEDKVPAGLLQILAKMLAKDPNDRYQSPAEVVEVLQPWVDHHLPPPPEREMPVLCPAVMALSGHAADLVKKSGSSVTRASALGRSVVPRSSGSSSNHLSLTGTTPNSPITPRTEQPTQAPTGVWQAGNDPQPAEPVETTPGEPPTGSGEFVNLLHPLSSRRWAPRHGSQRTLGIGLGLLATVAITAGIVWFNRGGGEPTRESANTQTLQATPPPKLTSPNSSIIQPIAKRPPPPTGPITSAEAHHYVTREASVVFKVARVGSSANGDLFLNATTSPQDPGAFTVFIHSQVAHKLQWDLMTIKNQFEGRTITVQGMIHNWRNAQGRYSIQIAITEATQITIDEPSTR